MRRNFRFTAPEKFEVAIENQQFEDPVSFVNGDFFKVFDVPFIKGDRNTAMELPFSVVLTESLAQKYYGTIDVIGRSLKLESEKDFTIAGVIANFPKDTHLTNGLYASHNSTARRGFAVDTSVAPYQYRLSVYLQISSGRPESLIAQINEIYQQEMQQLRAQSGSSRGFARRARSDSEPESLSLQALTDIHLAEAQHEVRQVNGKDVSVTKITYGMTNAIAVGLVIMILGISCCNYIYLSIARTSHRSKEIAMRKITGASRQQLFGQFMCESLIITLIAALLALLLSWILRPLVAGFVGVDEAAFGFANMDFLAILGLLLAITALLAGLYPALVLSGISPLQAFAGSSLRKVKLRRILVVCQFFVAALLLLVTAFIYQQLDWLDNADMGFDTNNVVSVTPQSRARGRESFASRAVSLHNELLQHPEIREVAISDGGPLNFFGVASTEVKLPEQSDDQFVEFNSLGVDDHFASLYRPRLQAGRFLNSEKYPSDTTQRERWTVTTGGGVVLTDTAMKMLSVTDPEQVVGKQLDVKITGFRGWGASDDIKQFTVVGVIDDINLGPGNAAIYPHMVMTSFTYPGYFAIKVSGKNNSESMQAIIDAFANNFPGMDIRNDYLSDLYQRENAALKKLARGFSVVALVSVLISCLGLYAIAAFTVERRTKEVGVRKAIGASVASIIRLLIWDFTKPVLMAIIVALPVAVLAIYKMLPYMPSHAPLGAMTYIEVVLAIVAIAWLTVLSHTLKTAVDDPPMGCGTSRSVLNNGILGNLNLFSCLERPLCN